jgi:hypothetical protein
MDGRTADDEHPHVRERKGAGFTFHLRPSAVKVFPSGVAGPRAVRKK